MHQAPTAVKVETKNKDISAMSLCVSCASADAYGATPHASTVPSLLDKKSVSPSALNDG